MLPDRINAHPTTRIFHQQPIYQITELLGAITVHFAYILNDVVFSYLTILPPKWRNPMPELIHEDAQPPQIHHLIIPLLLDNLRRHILQNPCESIQRLIVGIETGESKISDLNVPVSCNQHILRFQIPIDDIVDMQEADCLEDLRDELADEVLREFLVGEVVVKIAPVNVLHDYVDLVLVLEGVEDTHQEWVVRGADHLLDVVSLQQILLFYLLLVDYLHRVDFVGFYVFAFDQNHRAK